MMLGAKEKVSKDQVASKRRIILEPVWTTSMMPEVQRMRG
jgi:hypothetical protein